MLFLALFALALSGCSGDDGSTGATGAAGAAGATGATGPAGKDAGATINAASLSTADMAALTFSQTDSKVDSVIITSPPKVNFTVKNSAGVGVKGLGALNTAGTALNYLRFTIAKMVPSTGSSPSKWVSYIPSSTNLRPSTDSSSNISGLVDNGDGTYTYTFSTDITDPTKTNGVAYEPTLAHRLVIQISGNIPNVTPNTPLKNPINIIYDFIPATGAAAASGRDITTAALCNDCHEKIGVSTPHGGRVDTRYCVVCHTDQRGIGRTEAATDADGNFTARKSGTYLVAGRAVGDFPNMIHKTHMGNLLSKANYNYGRVFFDTMGFSMLDAGIRNCRKCHAASTAAPQGDNWKNNPSRLACGACHDNVDFATGAGHIGGRQATDAVCNLCHDDVSIETYHLTANATTNNPNVPTGLVNFTYEISGVTVNADNQAVIQFQIKKDGTAVTFDGAGSTASSAPAGAVLSGFSGSPSFLLAYADGTDTTVDFNNKGQAAAQPVSVSIAYLLAAGNTRGTITGPVSGVYTATITAAAYNFPVGSTMRTVALQGYFTQVAGTGGIAANAARHTLSVVKTVTGDTARRSVIDPAKCGACH